MKKIILGITSLALIFGLVYGTLNEDKEANAAERTKESEDTIVKNEKSNKFNIKLEANKAIQAVNSNESKSEIAKESHNAVPVLKGNDVAKELKKWTMRELIDSKYFENKDLPVKEAIAIAKERMKFEKAWFDLAKDEYGINYTEEEVDEFIKKGPDAKPTNLQKEYAQALGLTLVELNHDYDRIFYVKHVIWKKLAPVIQDKYALKVYEEPTKESEDPLHNRIIQKYEQEIRDHLSK